jgi:putative transposase
MRRAFAHLYVHLIWATWDRAPLLTAEVMEHVDRVVRAECVRMRADVVAFNGVADHVHLLVRYPAAVSVAQLVKQVKGVSSHLVGHQLAVPFKWQGGYGAFTVSRSQVPRVRQYVLDQQRHHADGSTRAPLELPELAVKPTTEQSAKADFV